MQHVATVMSEPARRRPTSTRRPRRHRLRRDSIDRVTFALPRSFIGTPFSTGVHLPLSCIRRFVRAVPEEHRQCAIRCRRGCRAPVPVPSWRAPGSMWPAPGTQAQCRHRRRKLLHLRPEDRTCRRGRVRGARPGRHASTRPEVQDLLLTDRDQTGLGCRRLVIMSHDRQSRQLRSILVLYGWSGEVS